MAYVSDNLRINDVAIGQGPRLWVYNTVADSLATITGAGYFADGYKQNMRVGDIVDVVASTGPKYSRYQVTVANATTGACTVAAPTAIT